MGMRLFVLVAVAAVLMSSCSFSADPEGRSAPELKTAMDAEARELIPALAAATDADLASMKAQFESCTGGFEYAAHGELNGTSEDPEGDIEKLRAVLEERGYDTAESKAGRSAVGTLDGLRVVILSTAVRSRPTSIIRAISMETPCASMDDREARDTPAEDYASYLD